MKIARLYRLFNPKTNRCFSVSLDHGFFNEASLLGGVENIRQIVETLVPAAPDALQLTLGLAPQLQRIPLRPKPALIMRADVTNVYNSPPPHLLYARMIEDPVAQAVRLDAACVVASLFSIPDQPEVSDQSMQNIMRLKFLCEQQGLPLMIEPLVFQPGTKGGGYAPNGDISKILPLVRQAVELGADVIKSDPTADIRLFHRVVEIAGDVPVLVRGGSRATESEIFLRTEEVLRQGAAGIVYGRNIVQHANPAAITRAFATMVHGGAKAIEAMRLLH